MDKKVKTIKQPPKWLTKYSLIILAVIIGITLIGSLSSSDTENTTTETTYQQAYNDSRLRDENSSVSFVAETGLMSAEYEQGDKLDSTDMVRSALSDFIKLGQKAFELENVQELSLTVNGDFKDSQGNAKKDIVLRISMSKAEFSKNDWKDLEYQSIFEIIQNSATNMIIDPSVVTSLNTEDVFYTP